MNVIIPEGISEEERKARLEDSANPIWKPIIYSGEQIDYYISNCGDVYSLKRNRLLSSTPSYKGKKKYWQIELSINNKPTYLLIHRLVAEAFCPNDDPEHKIQVDHLNADTLDCWYGNLEWVTPAVNTQRAHAMGLVPTRYGEDNPDAIYTNDQIHEVCKLICEGKGNTEIEKLTNVSRDAVDNIRARRQWKHIGDQYDFESVKWYPGKRVSEEDARKICELLQEGFTAPQIREKLPHVTLNSIYKLKSGSSSSGVTSQYDLHPRKSPNKITDDEIIHQICKLLASGLNPAAIHKLYPDCSIASIYNTLYGVAHKEIASQYKFPDTYKRSRLSDSELLAYRDKVLS